VTALDIALIALAAFAVLVGVVLQKITGSGVGAVSAPPLILILGPVAGVQVLHVVAALCSLVLLVGSWRAVEWRRTAILTGIAVAATPLGVVLAFALPETVLQIAVGLVMLTALFTVEALSRTWLLQSRWGIVATGVLGGVANGTVGQAGPFMSAYAVASRWALPYFVASMQVCWFVVNAVAAAIKGIPPVPPVLALALLGSLALGFVVSIPIARAMPRSVALRCLIVVAVLGSIVVLAKGLGGLIWPVP
jgi:uncharacterized membrane protein YfcA